MSVADPVHERPGFKEMLQRLAANGAKTIIVDSPGRFGTSTCRRISLLECLVARDAGKSAHQQV